MSATASTLCAGTPTMSAKVPTLCARRRFRVVVAICRNFEMHRPQPWNADYERQGAADDLQDADHRRADDFQDADYRRPLARRSGL